MKSAKYIDKVVFSGHRADERRVRNVEACLTVMGGWIIPHEGQVWAEPSSYCPVFHTASTHPPLLWCFLSQLGSQSSFPEKERGFQSKRYKVYIHTYLYNFSENVSSLRKGGKLGTPQISEHMEIPVPSPGSVS